MKSALLDSSQKIIGMNRLGSPTASPGRNEPATGPLKEFKDTQDSGKDQMQELSSEYEKAHRRTIDSR